MTHENLFKEVEDDLERQKYQDLWQRYGMLVIAAALAIIIGTSAYTIWQKHKTLSHQAATDELLAIQGRMQADDAKQMQALGEFASRLPGQAQATFATLQAAALATKLNQNDKAIALYDAVAKDSKADHAFRQLGDLSSVELQLDTGDAAALQKRLEPLMARNEPWHYSAAEMSGYLALRSGDTQKAKSLFTDLAQDAGAPKSISARAADIVRLLAP